MVRVTTSCIINGKISCLRDELPESLPSANQIVPLKFQWRYKNIHQTLLSSCSVEEGFGDETTSSGTAQLSVLFISYPQRTIQFNPSLPLATTIVQSAFYAWP